MKTMRTREEIQSEIKNLRTIKPRVLRTSKFGDDHHAAIDAQIEVLENLLTEDEVCDRHDNAADDEMFYADNEYDSGRDAANWLAGDEDDAPSEGWGSLIQS